MNKTILIIDDDAFQLKMLEMLLQQQGYESIATAESGEIALSYLTEKKVDVIGAVLLDINMPGIGGIETLKCIKILHPSIPVIIITASGKDEDREACLALGAEDYILKPLDPKKLIHILRKNRRE